MLDTKLMRFMGRTKIYLWQSVFVGWIRLLANIAFAYLFAGWLTKLLDEKPHTIFGFTYEVKYSLIVLVILLVVRHYAIKQMGHASTKIVAEVKHSLRRAVFEKVTSIGMGYHEILSTSEAVQLGAEGIEQLENYFGNYLTQFYYCFAAAITLFLSILPLNKTAAVVLAITALLIPLILLLILRIVKNVQRSYWNSYQNVGNIFLDSLQGLTTLKIYQADGKRAEDIAEKTESFRKHTMRLLSMQLNSMIIIDWIAYGGAAAGIIIALSAAETGNLDVFSCIVIILLAAEFFIPMKRLTSYFHVAMTGVTAGDKLLDFLMYKDKGTYGDERFPKAASISVENLTFKYNDENEKEALRNINMKIDNKGLTAIVGPSGCGKSTLSSILAGQIKTKGDNIFFIDNRKTKKIALGKLKKGELPRSITKVTHDGHIFEGTVRDNLRMGKPNAADNEMIAVLEEVNLWSFLSGEKGLDTMLLSKGSNISGGQAQRFSLARALLHDTPIYIFDEATSNVDVESEEIILDVISKIAKKKTVVYISHRLKNIQNADMIYVMEKGRVIEKGTHASLMAQSGLYKSLFIEQETLENYRFNGRRAVNE